jgi:hypothetical protein
MIQAAQAPSPWQVGNAVLYDLCSSRSAHCEESEVIAKMWLIGRSYAAAIERRKNKSKSDANDDFYIKTVAPTIIRSPIDSWIAEAKQYDHPSQKSFSTLLRVHHQTTQLFCEISGQNNRSLASKYLHFHVPQLFYIFDTRAVQALATLSIKLPKVKESGTQADTEYRPFAEKCLLLQKHIQVDYDTFLNPRELDNLLLSIAQ